MKILVVSLLRLGDIIQQKPLLRALSNKYPQAEVHLLINKQFAAVADLVSEHVSKTLHFDRELLQRSMGESSYNLFSPLTILDNLLTELQTEKYDLVLNWTHNRLSAFLLGTLDVPVKQGLHIQNAKLLGLESPWLKYFNDNFSGDSRSYFHYIELLGNAFELPYVKYPVRQNIFQARTIYMQCLTSDTKKNWHLKNFLQLKNLIEQQYPEFPVRILASESELSKLEAVFNQSEIVVCDLHEALSLLGQARMLISCDTSIKHLAAEAGTPVLEISLGGSDGLKTSAFSVERILIAAQSACYPCQHSERCPQRSHLCGESVKVGDVLKGFVQLMENDKPALVNRTEEIERAIWGAYLDQTDLNINLNQAEAQNLLKQTEQLLNYQLDFESCENFNQIFSSLQMIAEKKIDVGAYFQKLSQVFKDRFANAETAFSALKRALEQSQELLQLRLTLINKSLSMDGGTHAERP